MVTVHQAQAYLGEMCFGGINMKELMPTEELIHILTAATFMEMTGNVLCKCLSTVY